MTIDEKIHIFENSRLVSDNFAEEAVTAVYIEALAALRTQQEPKSPCAACGYGGKHLDAPPCTECPAHPKASEKNEPLTPDELEECRRNGTPVWIQVTGYESERFGWGITNMCPSVTQDFVGADLWYEGYPKTGWVAYRHPPKEV